MPARKPTPVTSSKVKALAKAKLETPLTARAKPAPAPRRPKAGRPGDRRRGVPGASAPQTRSPRASSSTSMLTRCSSRSCSRRRRPTPASTGDGELFSRGRHALEDAGLGRGALARATSRRSSLFNTKARNVIALSRAARRAATAARSRRRSRRSKRCRGSEEERERRRSTWRSASRPLPLIRTSSASPIAPAVRHGEHAAGS